jgi:hypothetical protein
MLNVYCYAKVFGERNCGTSFLQQLLRCNTALEVLSHGSNESALARVQALPAALQDFARERLLDQQRKNEFADNFGWKHAAVSPDYLQGGYRFHNTLFLFIVRNPFVFLASLYRRPYNAFRSEWPDKLSFLTSAWLCNERDRLSDILLDSPVQLWNLKNASYLRTHSQLPNSVLLRYETLVQAPEQFLQTLHERFGIRLADPITIPQGSTKGDTIAYAEYLDRALSYAPGADFSAEELREIAARIDWPLYNELGYARPDVGAVLTGDSS